MKGRFAAFQCQGDACGPSGPPGHPTLAAPLPPSYEEGAFLKGLRRIAAHSLIFPLRRERGTGDEGTGGFGTRPYQKGLRRYAAQFFINAARSAATLFPRPLFRKKGCRRGGGVFEPSSAVLAFPARWGRWRPQAPDEVGGCVHRGRPKPFGSHLTPPRPAGRTLCRGGCGLSKLLYHPTFATPLPPSYEEGAFKRFAPNGAFFISPRSRPKWRGRPRLWS